MGHTFPLTLYGYTVELSRQNIVAESRRIEIGGGYYLKPVCDPSIGPYVSLLHRILRISRRGCAGPADGDGLIGAEERSRGFQRNIYRVDIEIDGRYLRHANPTSERISDNARRRARNNRRVIQIEDAPPARLLMRFTYVGAAPGPPRFSPSRLSLHPRRGHFVKTARKRVTEG